MRNVLEVVEKYCIARQVIGGNMAHARFTHSEYVILIAFPRQQWLRERVLVLNCMYIALDLDGVCLLRGVTTVLKYNLVNVKGRVMA
jgi:hypothetical protein